MSTETEQLVVSLEARVDAFEKSFARASQTATTHWNAIETRGKSAADRIQADMARATASVANNFRNLGSSLAGSAGLTGILSAGGLLAAMVKINGELAKMASLAKVAELSTDRLQKVKYAANVKGVSDDTFATDIRVSLGLLDEAQRQVNSLQRLFNANGISIRDGNGELIKFDALLERAAQLMARAPSEAAKAKIAEMLGLSNEWIRALEGGPAAFRKLQDEARTSGVVVDASVIEKAKTFDREWKQAIVKFKAGFTSAFSELSDAFANWIKEMFDMVPGGDYLKRAFRFWGMNLRGMQMPELEAALKDAVDNGASGAAEHILAEIDRRTGRKPIEVVITPKVKDGPDTVIPRDVQKNPFDRAVFETNKRIAATNAETATIGLNSEARERARLVAELEEAAKKANTEAGFQNAAVTDAQREKINKLADAMEAAAKKNRETQKSWTDFNGLLEFSGNIAVDFVDKLGDRTQTLSDLALSALSMVKKAALQAAILGQGPLAGLFGTASTVAGGTGGIFGALGSLFGGARAEGGPVSPDKAYLVGERGPEVIVPRGPGFVVPNHALGGGSMAQSNTFHINIDGGGGTPQQNDDLVQKLSRALQTKVDAMAAGAIRQQLRPGGLLAR